MAVDRIGHVFADQGLLAQALTHRSAGAPHNERLEFLGDGVVNLLIAEALFQRWPKADEGAMTRARAELVREASLATIARTADATQHPAHNDGISIKLSALHPRYEDAQHQRVMAELVPRIGLRNRLGPFGQRSPRQDRRRIRPKRHAQLVGKSRIGNQKPRRGRSNRVNRQIQPRQHDQGLRIGDQPPSTEERLPHRARWVRYP